VKLGEIEEDIANVYIDLGLDDDSLRIFST
jgi:hypothetical protein